MARRKERRKAWARLLAKVHEPAVMACPRCRACMAVIAIIRRSGVRQEA